MRHCYGTCGLLLLMSLPVAGRAETSPRPNVVIFFVDDMGYADIGSFGSQRHRTPCLDRMAAEGTRFTQFYNGFTACSPSRSSLMTGCYASRIGMGGRVCFPNEPKALNPLEYTVAEMLKDAGYTTGIFGKWHLGHLPGYLPPAHGFDEYWGIPYSNDMWRGRYPPLPFIHNNEPVAIVAEGEDQALLTRAFTDAALSFIRKNSQRPFFAYVPFSAVHAPHFGHPNFLARVEKGFQGKPAYKAQVEEIDACVGEVISLLRELKRERTTLVLFMSDNGGTRESEKQPLRGGKAGPPYEGHMRTLLLTWWPGTIPAGKVCEGFGCTVDLLPTLATFCGGTLSEHKIDGVDLSAMFCDPEHTESPRRQIYYKGAGLREGQWKLLNGALYDLAADIGEQANLAAKHPDIVKSLGKKLEVLKKSIDEDGRPNARMKPCGPLVSMEDAKGLPRLAKWMVDRKSQ